MDLEERALAEICTQVMDALAPILSDDQWALDIRTYALFVHGAMLRQYERIINPPSDYPSWT